MIWQRSVVAKEKVRTIEVDDIDAGNSNITEGEAIK